MMRSDDDPFGARFIPGVGRIIVRCVMSLRKHQNLLVLIATMALALGGLVYLGMGLRAGWDDDGRDLQTREKEWTQFKQHVYPNVHLQQPVKAKVHSVYPPWALPLFGVFLGAGNFDLARAILQASSLLALAAMMWMGWRELSPYGWRWALLGAVMAMAIAGNYTALRWGQFSILCSGLLAGQVIAMQSGRPILAGLCWSLAMLKPQIALPFALLFLLQRQWRGLLVGGGVLTLLSASAFAWTNVSPLDYLLQGVGAERFRWVRTAKHAGVSTLWIEWLNLNPRWAILLGLGCLVSISAFLVLRKRPLHLSILSLAGVCAVLGHVLFYHRRYDDPMLYPLMLAITVRVHASGWKTVDGVTATLLGLTLFPPLPTSFVSQGGALSFLILAVPVATAVRLWMASSSSMPTSVPAPASNPCESPLNGR